MNPFIPGVFTIMAVVLVGCGHNHATRGSTAVPGNVVKNLRDDGSTKPTPMQGTTVTDLAITEAIRKAIAEDKTLSAQAHNVDVITKDGEVTLLGQVAYQAECVIIDEMAKKAAGVGAVHNKVEIVGKTK